MMLQKWALTGGLVMLIASLTAFSYAALRTGVNDCYTVYSRIYNPSPGCVVGECWPFCGLDWSAGPGPVRWWCECNNLETPDGVNDNEHCSPVVETVPNPGGGVAYLTHYCVEACPDSDDACVKMQGSGAGGAYVDGDRLCGCT